MRLNLCSPACPMECNNKVRVSGFGLRVPGFEFQFRIQTLVHHSRISWCETLSMSSRNRSHDISSGLNLVPDFGIRVPGSWFRFSGLGLQVSVSGFRISDFKFRVPGFGFWISGFGFRVFGFRVSGPGRRILYEKGIRFKNLVIKFTSQHVLD
jgi:hypothetical protein